MPASGEGAPHGLVEFNRDLAKFNHESVDLEGTLDDLVKVLQRAVAQLRNELLTVTGVGVRNQVISSDFGRRLKEVTMALSAATTCQNSLRKTAKERAAAMTPEERQTAVSRMIINLGYWDRRKLLTALCEAHNAKHAEALAIGAYAQGTPGEGGSQVGAGPSALFVELK